MDQNSQTLLPNKYHVVPRTLVFVTYNDEVLLIKGAPDKKIWPGLFNGIGGHIEKGEDILTSAKRELLEETALKDVTLKLKATIMIDVNDDQGIGLYVFLGKSNTRQVQNSAEGKLEWVKLDRISEYYLVEDLYTLIPLLFDKTINFLYGRYYYKNKKLVMEFLPDYSSDGF